jgi:hypothetical protein
VWRASTLAGKGRTCPLLLLLLLSACLEPAGRLMVEQMESPATAGAVMPQLSVGNSGAVSLSWIEPTAPRGYALRLALLDSTGWSRPRTAASLTGQFPSHTDRDGVRVGPCGMYLAHWRDSVDWDPARNGTELRTAISIDGAWTWTEPGRPYAEPEPGAHGFLSTFASFDGVGVTWIRGGGRTAELHTAVLGGNGVPVQGALVDSAVCGCCPTAAARTDRGAVVVYRGGRTVDGRPAQDILLRRKERGVWSRAHRVHADEWDLAGCPGHGPALAVRGDTLAVVWRTGAGGKNAVYLAWSFDAGDTFGPPIRVDEGAPEGQPTVALTRDGAIAGWEEDGALKARLVRLDGRAGPPVEVIPGMTPTARAAWTGAGDGMLVAWEVATGDGTRIALARVRRRH